MNTDTLFGESKKSLTDNNLVSVIIPCYKQAHFLGEAIESILSQTYQHFELIVVDDGSPDNTSEVAARYPHVRYIHQKNQGQGAARNTGFYESKGRYIVFLDADDRLLPNALEIGLKYLEAHPECAFVYGHVKCIAFDGTPLLAPEQRRIDQNHYIELLRNNYIWTPAVVMYQRAVLESVSGFNPSASPSEDFELNLRISRDFLVCCHGKLVAEYRLHGENVTRKFALMLKAAVSVRRSQKKYIKGNKQLKEAYKSGIRVVQNDYGEQLIDEIRVDIRAGKWKKVIQGALVLLHYYPRGLVKNICPRFLYRLNTFFYRLLIRFQLRIKSNKDSNTKPSYEGFHDGADCNIIHGWAWDTNQPNNPIYVDIYDDGILLAIVKAGEYRKDLIDAGKGNGRHAFTYIVPHWLKDEKPHSIRVRVTGTAFDLGFTPKQINCNSA